MKAYVREDILNRLQRIGFKPKFSEKNHKIISLSISIRQDIGIKVWGYLDFLRLPVIRREFKRSRKKSQTRIAKYYYFRWFPTKADANGWIKLFKGHFEYTKTYLNVTDRNDFRVQAEIII